MDTSVLSEVQWVRSEGCREDSSTSSVCTDDEPLLGNKARHGGGWKWEREQKTVGVWGERQGWGGWRGWKMIIGARLEENRLTNKICNKTNLLMVKRQRRRQHFGQQAPWQHFYDHCCWQNKLIVASMRKDGEGEEVLDIPLSHTQTHTQWL